MEKLIEIAVPLVLGEVASIVQKHFNLPPFWDEALNKLFQLNKIERDVSKLSSQMDEVKEAVGKLEFGKRRERIDEWLGKAHALTSDLFHRNEDIVKQVAALAYCLENSGVHELVIHDSKNGTAVIGQAAIRSNSEETLTSIIKMATSDSLVEKVEAYGYSATYEVVSMKCAFWRLLFVIDLVNVISFQWNGHSNIEPDPLEKEQQLLNLKEKLLTSWIIEEMRLEIVRSLKSYTFQKLAERINGSHPQDSKILNVFIVGSERTGRSTTSFLLSGKKIDDVSHLTEHARNYISVEEVTFDAYRIRFWDTPGLNVRNDLNRVRKRSLRNKMKAVNGISAVILQTNVDGYKSKQEISLVSMLKDEFPGPLSQNLVIAFKAGPESENRANHVQKWQSTLSSLDGVGTIDTSHYIHFDAPNLSLDNWEELRKLNSPAVEAVKEIVKNKVSTVHVDNWRVGERVLKCPDAQHSVRRKKIRSLYADCGEECSKEIKAVLDGARKLSATMENRDLAITVKSGCILYSPFHFAMRLCFKSSGQDLVLETTGAFNMEMGKEIVPDPNRRAHAKRKQRNRLSKQVAPLVVNCRKKCQMMDKGCKKLEQWRQYVLGPARDDSKKWIATICSDSFEFYRHDNTKARRPKYLIFEKECFVTEEAVNIVLKQLGVAALELLNLRLESTEEAVNIILNQFGVGDA